jgi:hypothetical protein
VQAVLVFTVALLIPSQFVVSYDHELSDRWIKMT